MYKILKQRYEYEQHSYAIANPFCDIKFKGGRP